MLKECKKVFDISLYFKEGPHRLESIKEDLAGLVIEAGVVPLEERINPRRFEIRNGQVIDPETGKDIRSNWNHENPLSKKESNAADSFYEILVNSRIGGLCISISPSGGPANYNEARINVGLRLNEECIEFYGIPSRISPQELLNLAKKAFNLTIENPEDLREIAIPIKIPQEISPWEFLKQIFPLDSDAWTSISQGIPWQIKEVASKDAERVAKFVGTLLPSASSEEDFIRIGAIAERQMQESGWRLNQSACPGLFNFQLLARLYAPNLAIRGYSLASHFIKDSFGNNRELSWIYHKGRCRKCGEDNVLVGPCKICKDCEKYYTKTFLN